VIASLRGMTVNLNAFWKYGERLQPLGFFDYGQLLAQIIIR
jgi:hypothetical protein